MFKNFIVGFGTVLALVSLGMATNVQAKLSKVLGVEPSIEKTVKPKIELVDCDAGEKVLAKAGFDHVFATDCTGAQYSFNGFRNSNEYTIVFNAHSSGFSTITK